MEKKEFEHKRKKLVEHLINSGYLRSSSVIEAMLAVPRENFMIESNIKQAYLDAPVSTLEGQTISAPHMNAIMCEVLNLKPGQKLLEIGTGSGYHAALCAKIVCQTDSNGIKGHVYTIERIESLVKFSRKNIERTGLDQEISVIFGDGTLGYAEEAPYDKILVTAAGPKIPDPLIRQLKIDGNLCIPVGKERHSQKLIVLTKTKEGMKEDYICNVVFVPLVGEFGF